MKAVLLDTHGWAWSLTDPARLSPRAVAVLEEAGTIFVSPISVYKIGQKVRRGKWPEMEPFIDRLPALIEEQGGRTAPMSPAICLRAATMDWAHRDPFDRLLAATAMSHAMPVLSADTAFDGLSDMKGWVARIW